MLQNFKAMPKAKDIDAEAFYRLVLTVRSVAVARPYNLIKFAENLPTVDVKPSECIFFGIYYEPNGHEKFYILIKLFLHW